MKNTKVVSMTKRGIMKEAHRRAKTYEGNYDACVALAMRELYREQAEMNEIAFIEELQAQPNYSNVSKATIKLVNDYIDYASPKTGKRRFSKEKTFELRTLIFDGSDDKNTIANVLFHASKQFKNIAKKYTNQDVFYNAEDVYMDAIEKIMNKVEKGERIESLSMAYRFEVMNIVKKENRRMTDKDRDSRKFGESKYTSMDSGNFKEVDLYTDSMEYFDNIPVNKIIRDIDMTNIFDSEQLKIISMRMKDMTKTEINKKFGKRMDRKFEAIEELGEAYFMYEYSI